MNAADETGLKNAVAPARTYRLQLLWRIFLPLSSLAMLFGGLVICYAALTQPGDLPIEGLTAIWLLGVATAALSVSIMVYFTGWRVTVTDDMIETSNWVSSRRLRRDEIAGRKIVQRWTVVVPSRAELKSICLPCHLLDPDTAFFVWLSGLRDLDAEGLRESTAAIAANVALGATCDERLRKLALAKKTAAGLKFTAIVLGLWSIVVPFPHPLVIVSLAVLPALAIALTLLSRELFHVGPGTNDARANLGMVAVFPALAIMARMLFDNYMVSWLPLIGAAVLGMALSTVALMICNRDLRQQPLKPLLVGLCTAIYAFGTIGEANALLDNSPATVFQSRILDKHIYHGKRTSYHLKLAPWGPLHETGDINVPSDVYNELEVNKMACVLVRRGALEMPWFSVQACH